MVHPSMFASSPADDAQSLLVSLLAGRVPHRSDLPPMPSRLRLQIVNGDALVPGTGAGDRKSTRLNSSHIAWSS